MQNRALFPASRALSLVMGLLLLPLGCGGDPTGPGSNLLCSDEPDDAIATFEDAILEAHVRGALMVGAQEDLTCGLVSGVTVLTANVVGIESLVGIQNLTGLTILHLAGNRFGKRIIDISPLSGLTSLTFLNLADNSISDISALSGLTSLTFLELTGNSISDISALSGLTSLTDLVLGNNSITDIGALSGLTSLTTLVLGSVSVCTPGSICRGNNSITDIGALSGLTSLTALNLSSNRVSDISVLSGLTSLGILQLDNNPNLTDIQPLLDNTGLGAGDTVLLRGTNVSCTDVAALEAKAVTVFSDCP